MEFSFDFERYVCPGRGKSHCSWPETNTKPVFGFDLWILMNGNGNGKCSWQPLFVVAFSHTSELKNPPLKIIQMSQRGTRKWL